MGAIPSGEGGDRFPLLPPPNRRIWGDLAGGGGGDVPSGTLHGSGEEEWEGGGGRGPARAQVMRLSC